MEEMLLKEETKIRQVYEDYNMVLKEAKSMGCNKIKGLYNIPLDTFETIVSALEKQVPKRFLDSYDEEMKSNWISCPICAKGIGWKYAIKEMHYCPNCGQKLDYR